VNIIDKVKEIWKHDFTSFFWIGVFITIFWGVWTIIWVDVLHWTAWSLQFFVPVPFVIRYFLEKKYWNPKDVK